MSISRMPSVPHRCLRCRAKWANGKAYGQLYEGVLGWGGSDAATYLCGARIYVSSRDGHSCTLKVDNCRNNFGYLGRTFGSPDKFSFKSDSDYVNWGI